MRFPYRQIAPGIIRPIIPIELRSHHVALPYEVLVDSGADLCVFDGAIGELLGFDVRSGPAQRISGVTGSSGVMYIHQIRMCIGRFAYNTPAAFSYDLGDYSYGVVGQRGLFDFFVVKFDLKKREVELKPYPHASN